MSLNWRFTDEERFNALSDEAREWNDAFVWSALVLDLRGITEKNIDEWLWRWEFNNRMQGPLYYKDNEPYLPTRAEVEARIGLTTNVSPKTRKQFVKKLTDRLTKEATPSQT